MTLDTLRQQISQFLRFTIPDAPITFDMHEGVTEADYRRLRISYQGDEGDEIPAFLFLPDGDGPFTAVLCHHQHHGQRHWGKSEVAGLVGDPLQAFGPALAKHGIIVLAPDSICFEDRRHNCQGTEVDEHDVDQHYNEMCYRLLRGDTLMRKVLSDSAQAISLLYAHPLVDKTRVGILGHSYGGNTVLFHAALDERIHFACSSGAACSYKQRFAQQTGIEMASTIPHFVVHYDIPDLVACVAPRPILLASATEDKFAEDAAWVAQTAEEKCQQLGVQTAIAQKRYEGGHALTPARFEEIVAWMAQFNT
jgi:dienelactone hydrolase